MNRIYELSKEIAELKAKLHEYDYVASKLAEAIAKAIVEGNNNELVSVYNEYKDILEQKQAWRDEINAKELEISVLKAGGSY